jgi:hypothetical protein
MKIQRTIMKKTTGTITRLGQMVILSCVIFFSYSCYSDCNKMELTLQETALLSAYNTGDIAVFKNDTTGVFDTLHVTQKGYGTTSSENCSHPVNNSLNAFFTFSHIGVYHFRIEHNKTPTISAFNGYEFLLSGSLNTMIINGATYNDVFVTSIDSTRIPSNYKSKVPWKINYSISNGFIRLYMVNGQTWSKL